ncbi:protein ADM2 [Spea bombifrons]|uniref:protein ADM2 n=1 Tax=Spea bombifrons TaxID=233779 RepID=UPI00234BB290|nr:protein ADM2 [Spea bombifrons]
MRSQMVMSLCYISLLCMQQLPGLQPLPSPNLLLLPTPREPPSKENHDQEGYLTDYQTITPSQNELRIDLRALQRKKRRAHRSQPVRLMRVGCALGTCQVQNLNYRLWLLVRRAGMEESPIQLSNPHSYG